MKAKISAGAEIDFLTKDELHDALTAMEKRLLAGKKWTKVIAQVTCDATGAISSVAAGNTHIGPNPGFVWSVKRMVLTLSGNVNSGSCALFVNSNNPGDIVLPSLAFPAGFTFSSDQFVMYPGDTLVVQATGAPANAVVTLSGQVEEVAAENAGRL